MKIGNDSFFLNNISAVKASSASIASTLIRYMLSWDLVR